MPYATSVLQFTVRNFDLQFCQNTTEGIGSCNNHLTWLHTPSLYVMWITLLDNENGLLVPKDWLNQSMADLQEQTVIELHRITLTNFQIWNRNKPFGGAKPNIMLSRHPILIFILLKQLAFTDENIIQQSAHNSKHVL